MEKIARFKIKSRKQKITAPTYTIISIIERFRIKFYIPFFLYICQYEYDSSY